MICAFIVKDVQDSLLCTDACNGLGLTSHILDVEAFGTRNRQTVDVALRQLGFGKNLARTLIVEFHIILRKIHKNHTQIPAGELFVTIDENTVDHR